jgi:hypothetical protein
MGPKERKRRLAKQRVDRSHRGVVRQYRPPRWTRSEEIVLVLDIVLSGVAVVIGVELFLL